MGGRKRQLCRDIENPSDHPFFIRYPGKSPQTQVKKSRNDIDQPKDIINKQTAFQKLSFTDSNTIDLDLFYLVEPSKTWQGMPRYRSFILGGHKYERNDFIFVANEKSVKRQALMDSAKHGGAREEEDENWVARVLEIRASDQNHVYACIHWLYRPCDIPHGTSEGKKKIQGRQPYHATKELIFSNHLDVIDVLSVLGPADVVQWNGSLDEEIKHTLFWRQAYNWRRSRISSTHRICICQTPASPDKYHLKCISSRCGKWMHHECLTHDILVKTLANLAIKDPEQAPGPFSDVPKDTASSSSGPTRGISVQKAHPQTRGLNSIGREAVQSSDFTARTTVSTHGQTSLNLNRPWDKSLGQKKDGESVYRDGPYLGLLEAELKTDEGSIRWEIQDRRPNAEEGERHWIDDVKCLFCGEVIR
jgi:hypothetical protein